MITNALQSVRMSPSVKSLHVNCYLCLKRPASQRKSHFTPASATEDVFGERTKEEVYAVTPEKVKVETYFGRSNSKNSDPTIRKDLNTEPFVFCKDCEEALGKIEEKVVTALNDVKARLQDGSAIIKRTSKFQKYIVINIHPNLFRLYLASVIWRQSFRQVYEGMDKVLTDDIYEQLRSVIADLILKNEDDIIASPFFEKFPDLICYTTIHENDDFEFVNPNCRHTNPRLFFMGKYDCLIFASQNIYPGFLGDTGLKLKVNDKQLNINTVNLSRIAVIPKKDWDLKRIKFAYHNKDLMRDSAIYQVAQARHISLKHAAQLIYQTANELEKETGKKYGICFSLAFSQLMERG